MLLPLIRSKPSIQGLVSFPVELVLVYRVGALAGGDAARVPLPRIDLTLSERPPD